MYKHADISIWDIINKLIDPVILVDNFLKLRKNYDKNHYTGDSTKLTISMIIN